MLMIMSLITFTKAKTPCVDKRRGHNAIVQTGGHCFLARRRFRIEQRSSARLASSDDTSYSTAEADDFARHTDNFCPF
jgi:hypothetical protein